MKWTRYFKNIQKRKIYKNIELIGRLKKTFFFYFNFNLLKLIVLKNNFKLFSFNYYKTQIGNFCIISGKSRGVHKKFKISRILLRELSAKGYFFGLKKASW